MNRIVRRVCVSWSVCFLLAAVPAMAQVRITEYMYGGTDGEFVEFTNVGNVPVDLDGWSFDDSSRTPGSQPLGAYGAVQPGESAVFTEAVVDTFRSQWHLCSGVKIIGGNTNNLGRADEINLYDNSNVLIDRLTYDDTTLGGPRTNGASGWVSASGLAANNPLDWTLSAAGDGEASFASDGGDIASPGRSTRASVAFDPCADTPDAPTITIDAATTSPFLGLAATTSGTASSVLGDPTDPAAAEGIGFTFALPGGGDPSTLAIGATSSDPAVVDAAGLHLSGSGATRLLKVAPHGVGYSTITLSATDTTNHTGTYTIHYATSAVTPFPANTVFLTGASDASATLKIDDQHMIVGDDETNILRLYRRDHSGLPQNGFDFSGQLNLTDAANPEIDIEASTRISNRLIWTGSFSTSKNFHVRPNRHRVFATDLSGTGANATLTYAGRYDWLLEDLVAWDHANGHGLGVDYLGFAASSAEGVDSKTSAGFNIEGLSIAPDNSTAYFAFRAPQLPTTARYQALIVPVPNIEALVTGAAPGSRPPGTATFGAPILLDLGGRGIRSLDRNEAGQYLITAGAAGDAGAAPNDFRLYAWTGQPSDAPFDLGVDLGTYDVNGGSFESLVDLPQWLGRGSTLQFLFDNGDSVWYDDGVAAKDLPDPRLKKAASLSINVDVSYPAATLMANGGTPQSAVVQQAFASPLAVHVADAYGHGVIGVNVVFAPPTSGASAILSTTGATTDADGVASVTATANATAGTYVVRASINGVASTAVFDLTNLENPADTIFHDGFDPLAQ